MAGQRFPTQEKASIEIYGRNDRTVADLRNLSTTGACLEWGEEDFRLRSGDVVRLTVLLKALDRRHNMSAEVVWVEGRKIGVNFITSDQVVEKISTRF